VFDLEQRAAAFPRGQVDLADLSVLFEQLLRQRDPDRLNDLKDNQFRNIFARMQRELPFDGDEPFSDQFQAIIQTISALTAASTTIINDRARRRRCLSFTGEDHRAGQRTAKLLDRATKSLAASRTEQDRFNLAVRNAMQTQAQNVNAGSFQAWIWTAIITLVCGATFGGLAMRISKT